MELKIQGLIVSTFKKDWPQAFVEMHKYIKEVMNKIIVLIKVFNF